MSKGRVDESDEDWRNLELPCKILKKKFDFCDLKSRLYLFFDNSTLGPKKVDLMVSVNLKWKDKD